MTRLQKLPPLFWLINKEGAYTPLNDKNVYLWYWKNGTKECIKVADTATAMQQIEAATAKDRGAYASTFIPALKQHGVFAFSCGGCTKEYALAKNVCKSINDAYKSILENHKTVSGKTSPIQTIKNDPTCSVVFVKYDNYDKLYAFRSKRQHSQGDVVGVFSNNEEKNVTVLFNEEMKESDIIEYANRHGYDDLSWVEKEDGYPEEYEEYPEDFSMAEAFAPVADTVYNGDLPDTTDLFPNGYCDIIDDDLPE